MDNIDISLLVAVAGIAIAAIVGMTANRKGNAVVAKNAIAFIVGVAVTYTVMKYSGW